MMIRGLSSAANSALNGLDNVANQMDDIAKNVAAGISSDPSGSASSGLDQISRIPALKQQAAANMRIIETVEQLSGELGSLLRR